MAKVGGPTLHRFRHTYATRLLEQGADIVTVQKLMAHSDIETTRQYLNPDEELKRGTVNRFVLRASTGKRERKMRNEPGSQLFWAFSQRPASASHAISLSREHRDKRYIACSSACWLEK